MRGVSTVVILTILAVIIVAAFIVIFYLKGAIPIGWTYDENSCRNRFLDLCDKIDKGDPTTKQQAQDEAGNLWPKCKRWFPEFANDPNYLHYCSYLLGHTVS